VVKPGDQPIVRFGNGDLNYGAQGPSIDSDDYFLIDKAYIEQRGVLSAPPVSAKVAQPQKAVAQRQTAKRKAVARTAKAHRRPQRRGHDAS